MPMEGVTTSSRSSMSTGTRQLLDHLLRHAGDVRRALDLGSTTTNSSPPMRQMLSPTRSCFTRRCRHFLEQRVAHAVSERVVDGLEAVES